jgi:hypothetical protein
MHMSYEKGSKIMQYEQTNFTRRIKLIAAIIEKNVTEKSQARLSGQGGG